MIFYADGRSRNIPLDVFRALKVILVLVVVLFISGTGITFYNYYRLSGLKGTYTQTLHNLSLEKPSLQQRIKKLRDFEEKISFFLSGAITDYDNTGAAVGQPEDVGMGEGEDEQLLDEEIILRSEMAEPELTTLSLNLYESADAGKPVTKLKKRLEELAVLAVKKKRRLDFTPSTRPVSGYISSNFGWRRSPFTGRRHYHRGIDIVADSGMFAHPDPYRLPLLRIVDIGVVDLHRIDSLGEVGRVSFDVNRVPDRQRPLGQFNRGDLDLAEIVADRPDLDFVRHF